MIEPIRPMPPPSYGPVKPEVTEMAKELKAPLKELIEALNTLQQNPTMFTTKEDLTRFAENIKALNAPASRAANL
jgi:hypothetical protein